MPISVVALGAGQDVGRSCVLVTLGGKNLMFDCGMHMGYEDDRRFPDFDYINQGKDTTALLDVVLITHFHLDHCGALPWLTERVGYKGTVIMSQPTKAICPILLEDYRRIQEGKGERDFFSSDDIQKCMAKVRTMQVQETISINGIEITAYYAGHVLGAAMFLVRVGGESVLYTGDYNMTPDRHLGSAWVDKCQPDLLITESTYATTIRDSRRMRERDFLKKVHACVENGGKVLIPVFALGRAQELCILIESYWERMGLKVPVYFSAGLTQRANEYYKLFISWTNEKIKNTFVKRNMFDFKHIRGFERSFAENKGPQVLFATPGMLHAGTSLDVFKKWAPDERNMIILPGYCVQGTVGAKVLAGEKRIDIDGRGTFVDVRMSVQNLSFSAHADSKGIAQLVRMAGPKNVMLVHGERRKMIELKQKITREMNINCYDPPNGTVVQIETEPSIRVGLAQSLFKREREDLELNLALSKRMQNPPAPLTALPIHACLIDSTSAGDGPVVVETSKAIEALGLPVYRLKFTHTARMEDTHTRFAQLKEYLFDWMASSPFGPAAVVSEDYNSAEKITIRSLEITLAQSGPEAIIVSWNFEDESIADLVFDFLKV